MKLFGRSQRKRQPTQPQMQERIDGMIKKHLELLGHEVKDKVSDYKGVVTSVTFDLYGCVQALVRPSKLREDGDFQSGAWLDVGRLKVISNSPLMDQPNFMPERVAEGKKGPAKLPLK